jgi:hypothetical protein
MPQDRFQLFQSDCVFNREDRDYENLVTWPISRHLGQVVPVVKTGLRGDYDFLKRASKAGRENDRVWKA